MTNTVLFDELPKCPVYEPDRNFAAVYRGKSAPNELFYYYFFFYFY